jgi:hypothetical protein
MSEIETLLEELKKMNKNNTNKIIPNNKTTWEFIRKKDWTSAGFENEAEAITWIEQNPYNF